MRKCVVVAMIACLMVPSVVMGQKGQSPFEAYMKLQTAESFVDAYSAYAAQEKDSTIYDAAARLAWLNVCELDRNLGILKAGGAKLDIATLYRYANVLLALGRYDEAIDLYKQLNEQAPEWAGPWQQRGTASWREGKNDEAVKYLNKAIETQKEQAGAYIVLAEVYKDMNQSGKALKTLEEGLAYYGKSAGNAAGIESFVREPSNLDVQFLYLELLKKAGAATDYQAQLEKVRGLAPGDERLQQYK